MSALRQDALLPMTGPQRAALKKRIKDGPPPTTPLMDVVEIARRSSGDLTEISSRLLKDTIDHLKIRIGVVRKQPQVAWRRAQLRFLTRWMDLVQQELERR